MCHISKFRINLDIKVGLDQAQVPCSIRTSRDLEWTIPLALAPSVTPPFPAFPVPSIHSYGQAVPGLPSFMEVSPPQYTDKAGVWNPDTEVCQQSEWGLEWPWPSQGLGSTSR